MKAVLPGKPQPKLQAIDTNSWQGSRLVAYVSANALIILSGPNQLVQTIACDDHDELNAVAIDGASGKIAISSATTVYIYRQIGHDSQSLKWALQDTFQPSCGDKDICSLSWGLPEELLIGGSFLTLLWTDNGLQEQWSKQLASRSKFCAFSHDASLVATTAWHDRLVKIWRRQFTGGGDERFDAAYLPHPSTVTSIRWRGRSAQEHQHWDTVLYTTCTDHHLRIWTASDPHCIQILQLWTAIDLVQCIQPEDPLSPSPFKKRWVLILDSWDFSTLVDQIFESPAPGEREMHARQHLREVSSQNPEVCIVLDEIGNMSAWGLERIGCKARQERDVFNFAHAQKLDFGLPKECSSLNDYARLYVFTDSDQVGHLSFITHVFDGSLRWISAPVDRLFDPSTQVPRLQTAGVLTGHAEVITSLKSAFDQQTLVSLAGKEVIVWQKSPDQSSFERQSMALLPSPAFDCTFFPEEGLVAFIDGISISLWDMRSLKATKLTVQRHGLDEDHLSLVLLRGFRQNSRLLVVISKTLAGSVWECQWDLEKQLVSLSQCKSFGAKLQDVSTHPGLLSQSQVPSDTFQSQSVEDVNPILTTCDTSCIVQSLRLVTDKQNKEVFLKGIHRNSIIRCSRPTIAASSVQKLAYSNFEATSFSIWDLDEGWLEFKQSFREHEVIQRMTFQNQTESVPPLAVCFSHKVLFFSPRRFDIITAASSWSMVRSLSLAELTSLPISDSLWLSSRDFTIAAGGQIFLYDFDESTDDAMSDRKSASRTSQDDVAAHSILSGNSLPLYHPQILISALAAGKLKSVPRMLYKLNNTLKFWTEGDPIDPFLNIASDVVFDKRGGAMNAGTEFKGQYLDEENNQAYGPEVAAELCERLKETRLPGLSSKDAECLVRICRSQGSVQKFQKSVDLFGLRYLASLELQTPGVLSWKDFLWATLSNSQQVLIDSTSQIYQDKLRWEQASASGMFMWISDLEDLRNQFEVIARNEYAKTEERNPIDCSLYYLALRKKQVMVRLWRMATWNREQAATLRMLSNDFDDARWKTAALKNAYALMGKRRHEYAASFFLLADRLKDAVGILANQLGNLQLAIAVARVYEGDDGPVLTNLLQEKVLPTANETGDRWMAVWALLMLKREDAALRALTENPLHLALGLEEPDSLEARSWKNEDPSLVNLYEHLRDRIISRPRHNFNVSPIAEWGLVMRSVRLYNRMRCNVLALDLVRHWRFTKSADIDKPVPEQAEATVKEVSESTFEEKPQEVEPTPAMNGKARKQVLEEPSTKSILDDFDF